MRTLTAILPLTAFLASPVMAEPVAAQRVGHYYLRGVMETGSELLLKPDGRFQWYLAYGALDLFAEGRWIERGGFVILTSEKTKDVPESGFETLALTIRKTSLIPPDGRGAYIRTSDEKD